MNAAGIHREKVISSAKNYHKKSLGKIQSALYRNKANSISHSLLNVMLSGVSQKKEIKSRD